MATESAIAEASGQPVAFFALPPAQRNAAGQARDEAANLRGRLAAFESVTTSPASPKAGQAKPRGRGSS
ncbi:hypothetical protein XvhCFBP2543_20120 [Xanthomonas vasicola]|nr:hypothetical protein XvhCFBP2543_20120 [Xanthomonas vasicola]TWQ66053.1 hypothetical protein FQJ91_19460 [Xanthomonas vasicola]TWQ71376.1 hypothetical protein FQJ92_11605 [Xanthomonas vasicola]TWQ73736.1 hypothetical protein FQJ89_18015 [Xanthomonas vasicola]TWQ90534.1 hypothetical protein FQJ88_19015 [Xanthomonas vasicola]